MENNRLLTEAEILEPKTLRKIEEAVRGKRQSLEGGMEYSARMGARMTDKDRARLDELSRLADSLRHLAERKEMEGDQ